MAILGEGQKAEERWSRGRSDLSFTYRLCYLLCFGIIAFSQWGKPGWFCQHFLVSLSFRKQLSKGAVFSHGANS